MTKDLPLERSRPAQSSYQIQYETRALICPTARIWQKKYLQPYPAVFMLEPLTTDAYHMLENQLELPFRPDAQRVIDKGYPQFTK